MPAAGPVHGCGVIGRAPRRRCRGSVRACAAGAILERLVDAELRVTRLFHAAAEAGRTRDALGCVRELTRVVELLAKVADEMPAPPAPGPAPPAPGPAAPVFAWPGGELRPAVPVESEAELAYHHGYVRAENQTWRTARRTMMSRPRRTHPPPAPRRNLMTRCGSCR